MGWDGLGVFFGFCCGYGCVGLGVVVVFVGLVVFVCCFGVGFCVFYVVFLGGCGYELCSCVYFGIWDFC